MWRSATLRLIAWPRWAVPSSSFGRAASGASAAAACRCSSARSCCPCSTPAFEQRCKCGIESASFCVRLRPAAALAWLHAGPAHVHVIAYDDMDSGVIARIHSLLDRARRKIGPREQGERGLLGCCWGAACAGWLPACGRRCLLLNSPQSKRQIEGRQVR